ncbi:hypothetical protein EYR38_002732 [Pleurotus pulmonarius]|nr:hypothetical protein EYR38_002732 [Pleurotus pulmonarius]
MNAPLVLPRKHRKGKVGAGLPFEPWELPGPPSSMLSPRGQDFTSELDTDFLDFTDDDDDFDDFDDPTASADEQTFHSHRASGRVPEAFLAPILLPLSQEDRSSSRRSDDSKHSASGQPHSSSAESDSDIPNSPPDESYFIFPRSLSPDCLLVDEDHEELDGVGYEIGSGVDVPYHGLDRTPHHSIYFHHTNSLSMGSTDAAAFEPGSSEGTIRGSSFHAWALSRGRRHSNKCMTGDDNDEMVEGSEWQGGQNGHYSSNGSAGYYGGNSAHGRASGRSNGGFGGGSNWGNGGDDGDDRRGRRGREGHGHHTEPTSGSEEEQSESEDDYGVPSASQSKKTVPNDYSASDDDVPLAQRIPTALRAQKTIRRKVKEERDQRRRERAAKAALNGELHPPHPRTPLTPAGPSGHYPGADSQEPIVQTRSGRMRTMTMPSNSPRPFAVEDLSKRLEAVQIPEPQARIERARSKSRSRIPSPDRNPLPMPEMPQLRRSKSRHPSPDRNPLPTHEPGRSLRPMRSFHRTETRPLVDRAAPPIPVEHQKLARSKTEGRSRRRDDLTVEHGVKSKSLNMQATESADIEQFARGRRQDEGQATTVHLSARQRSVSRPSRPSMDRDAYPVPRKSLQRQTPSPIPPLPLADIKTTVVTQQRVFIGDMQSFNTVEISSNTTAQDVLDMVKAQGSLKQYIGSGGWMLFEVAQDFGMERPIRSFELLADVQASWNKDKMVNMFVIKMTSLTSILSRSNIPSSSPMHSGWVEWEAKRGKWTKRWMQLREHSLWLSKRDSGKDETFLCSLSNFDAYAVTRVHKAPKPYVFATKSTDNLSFFENTADYLHVFSCSQKDGEKWMEVILLARSYVLYQEKNVLFNPKAGSSTTSGTGLSRSGTRKTPSGRTGQTFVDVSSPDVFVPGSLLHRKS